MNVSNVHDYLPPFFYKRIGLRMFDEFVYLLIKAKFYTHSGIINNPDLDIALERCIVLLTN